MRRRLLIAIAALAVVAALPTAAVASGRGFAIPGWMQQMMANAPPQMQQMMISPAMQRMTASPPPGMEEMMQAPGMAQMMENPSPGMHQMMQAPGMQRLMQAGGQ